MINQKKLFCVLIFISLVIHSVFYFVSKRIVINIGYGFDEKIKSAFRIKNISIIPVSYLRRRRRDVKKIKFWDLKAQVLNEKKKLFFDSSLFDINKPQKSFMDDTDSSFETKNILNEYIKKERDKRYVEEIIKSSNVDVIKMTKKRTIISRNDHSEALLNGLKKSVFKNSFKGKKYTINDFLKGVHKERIGYDMQMDLVEKKEIGIKIRTINKKDFSYYRENLIGEKLKKKEFSHLYLNLDKYIKVKTKFSYSKIYNRGFFKTTLSVCGAKNKLGSFPKDIVFVLDISRSMDDEQVSKIIKGVKKIILTKLDLEDRFNIVLFSKKNKFFSEDLINAKTYGLKRQLDAFFGKIVMRGQTDVYASLSDIINRWPVEKKRAAIIVLISDGYSTSGIKDPQELIRKITKLNNGNWRIYCFGNYRADKYLLDMLSYMNRGYSVYEKNFIRIERGLLKLFMEIKDPVVLNVKFQYTGIGVKKLYPIVIPDLFEGGSISLYGFFEKKDSIFSGRIIGDTLNGKGEVIIYEDFEKLEPTKDYRNLEKEFFREMSFEQKKP